MKSFDICAQNIDCGYSLEPPHLGNCVKYPQFMLRAKYTPVNPSFTMQKWGSNGSCLQHDEFCHKVVHTCIVSV